MAYAEECIAIEIEQMKIKSGESYIDFCHRIQQMRSSIIAKVNLIHDEGVKSAKMIVYNNMALNVFLYNLPEDLIRIVRLKQCGNLELALSIVTEEVNFMNQYNAKHKRQNAAPQGFKVQSTTNLALLPNTTSSFRFGSPQFHQNKFQMPNQNFKFVNLNNNRFNNLKVIDSGLKTNQVLTDSIKAPAHKILGLAPQGNPQTSALVLTKAKAIGHHSIITSLDHHQQGSVNLNITLNSEFPINIHKSISRL